MHASWLGHRMARKSATPLVRQRGLAQDQDRQKVELLALLRACAKNKDLPNGITLHDNILRRGLLGTDIVLGTAVIDVYAKCGALAEARRVLEQLPVRDVVAWNALISGYSYWCKCAQALESLAQMKGEGLSPDAVTFTFMLKVCGSSGAAEKGEQFHDEIVKLHLLRSDVVLGNALVDMYAKCGALTKARGVLEELPIRNVITWTTLISGYVEQGEGHQALDCFKRMKQEGLSPNAVTFSCILKACGIIKQAEMGEKFHNKMAKQGILENNPVLHTALVDMYAKCGALAKAHQVLEELPVRNVISYSALIAGYVGQGQGEQAVSCLEMMQQEGLFPDAATYACILKACGSIQEFSKGQKIHDVITKEGLLGNNVVLGNALLDMYVKCGALQKALQVLEELPVRNVISWSALISGFAHHGDVKQALNLYNGMEHDGLCPDKVTFSCILKACGSLGALVMGEKIHDKIAKLGMLVSDSVLGNALVDMYAKCGALAKARQVLEELPVRDVISWNTLISGYVQKDEGAEVLNCFEQMQREGLSPDVVTLTCALKACGSIGAAEKGERIYEELANQGLLAQNLVLGNAVVDMFAKCAELEKAQEVIYELPARDVISWNALIAGYAEQGKGAKALDFLEQMWWEGISPDASTLSSMLRACSRVGLVGDAQMLFVIMSTKYGLNPDAEHYTSLVDLFGRAGHLDMAVRMLENVPSSNREIWSAVLGACQKWGDVKVGRWAFEHAVQADKNDPAIYVVMTKIYAAAGMQKDADNVMAMRKERDNRESRVQRVGGDRVENVHVFLVKHRRHARIFSKFASTGVDCLHGDTHHNLPQCDLSTASLEVAQMLKTSFFSKIVNLKCVVALLKIKAALVEMWVASHFKTLCCFPRKFCVSAHWLLSIIDHIVWKVLHICFGLRLEVDKG